jgi:hypothetical protein
MYNSSYAKLRIQNYLFTKLRIQAMQINNPILISMLINYFQYIKNINEDSKVYPKYYLGIRE